jgi:hypothetical protein
MVVTEPSITHSVRRKDDSMTDLGRIQLHDEQSWAYQLRGRPQRGLHVRHAMNAPHVDQFYTSGCVGYSGTNMLNCAAAARSRVVFNRVNPVDKAGRTYLGNNDGLRNYSEATKRDPFSWEYPPTDEGSSAVGLMKFWKQAGVISAYRWTFDFNSFLAVLQQQPVLVGTNWHDDMMDTEPDGLIRSTASDRNPGGHEYLATEIHYGSQLLGFEQSWGETPPSFGREGRFFMTFDLAEELIINQGGDVAVPSFL